MHGDAQSSRHKNFIFVDFGFFLKVYEVKWVLKLNICIF